MGQPSQLHMAFARCKYADPLAFNDVLRSAEHAELDALKAMRDAPPDEVREAQGYARAMKWLVGILKECNAMKLR